MWRLDVSSEAELEIFEAALRYERERENPFQFPVIEEDARRALVRDFPYGVFFTTEADLIMVLAVLHLSRHPDTWKRRRRDTQ